MNIKPLAFLLCLVSCPIFYIKGAESKKLARYLSCSNCSEPAPFCSSFCASCEKTLICLKAERIEKNGALWEHTQTIDPTKKGLEILASLTKDAREELLEKLTTKTCDGKTMFLHRFKNLQIQLWQNTQNQERRHANIEGLEKRRTELMEEFTKTVGILLSKDDLEPIVLHSAINLTPLE